MVYGLRESASGKFSEWRKLTPEQKKQLNKALKNACMKDDTLNALNEMMGAIRTVTPEDVLKIDTSMKDVIEKAATIQRVLAKDNKVIADMCIINGSDQFAIDLYPDCLSSKIKSHKDSTDFVLISVLLKLGLYSRIMDSFIKKYS